MGFEKRFNEATGSTLVRVTVGYRQGKPVRVSKTFPRGTPEHEMLLWSVQAREGGVPGARSLPFDELIDEWLAYKEPQLAVSTFRIYTLGCNAYLKGKLGITAEVTTAEVKALVGSYAHLAPESIARIRSHLKMIFDYAVEQGYVHTSPVTGAVKIPKKRRKRKIRVLTVAQFDALADALRTDHEVDLALLTLLMSGLRVSELLALQPWHVTETTLTVEQSLESRYGERITTPPKSDHAYRTINIPEQLSERLLALPHQAFLFETGYKCLRKTIGRRCKALALPPMNLQGLRHSHCTYLLAKGVNVLAVSRRLGHHSPAFTLSVYGHLIPSMNDKVLEVLK